MALCTCHQGTTCRILETCGSSIQWESSSVIIIHMYCNGYGNDITIHEYSIKNGQKPVDTHTTMVDGSRQIFFICRQFQEMIAFVHCGPVHVV